jgi:hypothetical protein
MMKHLISLHKNTQTEEEVYRESVAARKKYDNIYKQELAKLVKAKSEKVGLTKCVTCGEYKGLAEDEDGEIEVMCICKGIYCTKCGINIIHRPISNFFSTDDAKIWHVPYFHHMCSECTTHGLE